MIESLMEHIAYSINKDPLEIRLMNIDQTKEDKLLSFIDEIKMWAEIDKRKKEIAEFNKVKLNKYYLFSCYITHCIVE